MSGRESHRCAREYVNVADAIKSKANGCTVFFDLNPSKRRDLFDSPCHHFVRLSYGPNMEVLKMGLDGIDRVVKVYSSDVPDFHMLIFHLQKARRDSEVRKSDPSALEEEDDD